MTSSQPARHAQPTAPAAGPEVVVAVRASTQEGTHPRPQLLRQRWSDLGGTWQLAVDDQRTGVDDRWQDVSAEGGLHDRSTFDHDVLVPFPPESAASGLSLRGSHPVLWYRRGVRLRDVAGGERVRPGGGARLLLRFGAVDHCAQVWWDGHLVTVHEGGQTPFSADVTALVDTGAPGALDVEHVLVVRALDEADDVTQPRGKQDWREEPHGIWYHRTSGIWQPVWAEVVPALHVEHLTWRPDLPGRAVELLVELSGRPAQPVRVAVRLALEGALLAEQVVTTDQRHVRLLVALPALDNGQAVQDLVWSPEHPRLVDAEVALEPLQAGGDPLDPLDVVWSYLGLRSTGVGGGALLLNGRPEPFRAVLEQGYWPDSHLAAPSAQALREEVQLIKDLGFNGVRVHQKAEDPRFLFWADRLGLLVWGETANAYAFSPEAVRRLTAEWTALVRRDASHPSVVAWVPLNESWGVQDISVSPAQQSYASALAALTRALDPTRPVVSNDGWEHTDSDLVTVHDYAATGAELAERYGSQGAVRALREGMGPAGRVLHAAALADRGQPVLLTEFGGVRFSPGEEPTGAWGYSSATSAEDFEARLRDLYAAVHASPVLAGSCYTQLTDTLQEANGLVDAHRRPKLPVKVIAAIITGADPRERPA